MKKDAEKMTFLIPNMAPIHFGLIRQVFVNFGYGAVLLENTSSKVLEAGLKYVQDHTALKSKPAIVARLL